MSIKQIQLPVLFATLLTGLVFAAESVTLLKPSQVFGGEKMHTGSITEGSNHE